MSKPVHNILYTLYIYDIVPTIYNYIIYIYYD